MWEWTPTFPSGKANFIAKSPRNKIKKPVNEDLSREEVLDCVYVRKYKRITNH